MSLYFRQNRVPIRISGADASKLLNSTLSADFIKGEKTPLWWALLSPQGKIQAEGLAIYFDKAFWLDVHISIKNAFLKRMSLYKMRSEVEITDLSESHKIGFCSKNPNLDISFKDPRHKNLGFQIIATKEKTNNWLNDDIFTTLRIKAGVSELGEDFEPDKYFPHDIGMDILKAVDFSKGCYIGQEIVSRMQHKAEIRRRPMLVSNIEAQKGTKIEIDNKQVGIIGQVANNQAIGFVRIDKINNIDTVKINDKPVQLALPDWAYYHLAKESNIK